MTKYVHVQLVPGEEISLFDMAPMATCDKYEMSRFIANVTRLVLGACARAGLVAEQVDFLDDRALEVAVTVGYPGDSNAEPLVLIMTTDIIRRVPAQKTIDAIMLAVRRL